MIEVIEGYCYIFGPHVDGFYSVEKVARVLEDGIIISYFRGNAHQQRHIPEEVFAKVGCNCEKHWFSPEEVGVNKEQAKIKGKELQKERYERRKKLLK